MVYILECLGVIAILAIYAGGPAPEVNEPCYLVKAVHYWQPDYLAGDLFLESSDPHFVFQATFGWLGYFVDLPTFAYIGRAISWVAIAWAWVYLSRGIAPLPGLSIVTMALTLWMQARFEMAGEWVVRGFEAKVLSYACIYAALGATARQKWNWTGVWLGGAVLYHVVVGGWASVATGLSVVLFGRAAIFEWKRWIPGAVIWAACSAVAIVPNLGLSHGVTPAEAAETHQFLVYRRLPHHLDFRKMRASAKLDQLKLLVAWSVLLAIVCAARKRHRALVRRLLRVEAVVVGGMCIVLCGLAITYALPDQHPAAASFLRFYWYRLNDALLPVGVALAAATLVMIVRNQPLRRNVALIVLALLVANSLRLALPLYIGADRPRALIKESEESYQNWLDVCRWFRAETPPDARVMVARHAYWFKWYAERVDVMNWKDMPQDAKGLVEWWRRMDELYIWDPQGGKFSRSIDEIPTAEIVAFARKYDADYVITDSDAPLDLPRVYRQPGRDGLAVYRIDPEAASEAKP